MTHQHPCTTIGTRPDCHRPGADRHDFEALLDASSLGSPIVLDHQAEVPDWAFAKLDQALDEAACDEQRRERNQGDLVPSRSADGVDGRQGDVDDVLLYLVHRGSQLVDTNALLARREVNDRGTRPWQPPVVVEGNVDCNLLLMLHFSYLPAIERQSVVAFVASGHPAKVRDVVSDLWALDLFAHVRADVARVMVSIGFDHRSRFAPILNACSSAVSAMDFGDEVAEYLRSVTGDRNTATTRLVSAHPVLPPGRTRAAIEAKAASTTVSSGRRPASPVQSTRVLHPEARTSRGRRRQDPDRHRHNGQSSEGLLALREVVLARVAFLVSIPLTVAGLVTMLAVNR